MAEKKLLKTVAELRKRGQNSEALRLLRDALRRCRLGPEETEAAGRYLLRELDVGNTGEKPLSVLLLGQCTTSWLKSTLAAVGWGRNLSLMVQDGEYDNVIQELSHLDPAAPPDLLLLLPWHGRLFESQGRSPEERIEDELTFWKQAWKLAVSRGVKRLLQVGYDWVVPGAWGYLLGGRLGGDVELVRKLNERLRGSLPQGALLLPLEEISGTLGRIRFYDPRRHAWTRQPFSEEGLLALANHLVAAIRALFSGPKKVLAVDLDNTLWGGQVGETGPFGIHVCESPEGEAFRAFQKHLRALSRRGVLLTALSKNNLADAREPFEKNPEMVLSLDDFAYFSANWEPKAVNLRRTAEVLSLGLDSFVFFDDDPAEREAIRQALPEVEVVEVPEDPVEYVRVLQEGLWFETAGLTAEDEQRTSRYAAEKQRRALRSEAGDLATYLGSLEMVATVRPVDEPDLQRVIQLLAKTNQFNLTTRRHGEAEVRELLSRPGVLSYILCLRDRFGDHGLVAVLFGVPGETPGSRTLRIDTLLMSCRVIGRTVEQFLLEQFLREAERLGYVEVIGEYRPTSKNALVSGFYPALGFLPLSEEGDGTLWFRVSLPRSGSLASHVRAGD